MGDDTVQIQRLAGELSTIPPLDKMHPEEALPLARYLVNQEGGPALKARLFDEMAQDILDHWPGDITSPRNTGDPGGLPGVVTGVFEERDELEATLATERRESPRLREELEAGQGRSHEIAPKPSARWSAIATAEAFRDAGIVIGVPLKEPAEH